MPRSPQRFALSLPDPPSPPPAHLRLFVGQLEQSGFHHSGATSVAWADHVTILYSDRAHHDAVEWLSSTMDQPLQPAAPAPWARLAAGALLVAAFTLGLAALPRRSAMLLHPALVLGYSLAAVAIPVHFGMTNVWPTGWRWLLVPAVIAGSAAFGFGLQFLAKGRFWVHLGLSMAIP